MSTPSALASEVRPYRGRVIRIVEGQHLISTNLLAANPADQALLEALAAPVAGRGAGRGSLLWTAGTTRSRRPGGSMFDADPGSTLRAD